MRPQNWEKFSFGAWLKAAQPRLHRNKLATALANKLARIAWSVLRHNTPSVPIEVRSWQSDRPGTHPRSSRLRTAAWNGSVSAPRV